MADPVLDALSLQLESCRRTALDQARAEARRLRIVGFSSKGMGFLPVTKSGKVVGAEIMAQHLSYLAATLCALDAYAGGGLPRSMTPEIGSAIVRFGRGWADDREEWLSRARAELFGREAVSEEGGTP